MPLDSTTGWRSAPPAYHTLQSTQETKAQITICTNGFAKRQLANSRKRLRPPPTAHHYLPHLPPRKPSSNAPPSNSYEVGKFALMARLQRYLKPGRRRSLTSTTIRIYAAFWGVEPCVKSSSRPYMPVVHEEYVNSGKLAAGMAENQLLTTSHEKVLAFARKTSTTPTSMTHWLLECSITRMRVAATEIRCYRFRTEWELGFTTKWFWESNLL